MNKWLMCVVTLILGMLLANMLQNVCGCKVVEGGEAASTVECVLELPNDQTKAWNVCGDGVAHCYDFLNTIKYKGKTLEDLCKSPKKTEDPCNKRLLTDGKTAERSFKDKNGDWHNINPSWCVQAQTDPTVTPVISDPGHQ